MTTYQCFSISFSGLISNKILVQVQISPGLPAFSLVGLPDKSVLEARDRVKSALFSLGIQLPAKKIVINLSPGNVTKISSHYDLPIAISILKALGYIKSEIFNNCLFMGELGLDASCYRVKEIIPAAIFCNRKKINFIYPFKNSEEVSFFHSHKQNNIMFLGI
jgi:magnesium chelatase family protein